MCLHPTFRKLICSFILTAALLIPISTFAQEGTIPQEEASSVDAAPLMRHLDRSAPDRPVIISSPVDGASSSAESAIRTIVEIPAIADTYIASERPNESFGGDALFLGFNQFGDRYGAQRILLRFNVDSIPDNARIRSAQIRLRLSFSSPDTDAPMRTVIRRLASDWSEFDVTWNSEPSWASVRDSSFIDSTPSYYEWEVPDLVQGWVDNSFPNFGVEIIGDENVQQRERVFYARETDTNYFPQLLVEYDVIDDTDAPQVSVAPLPSFVGRSFVVRWTGDDVGDAGIDYYDVQYRIDGGDWVDWLSGVTTQSEEFSNGQNGRQYEFRARGVDEAGNVEPFGAVEAFTTIDSGPPISQVSPLPNITQTDSFVVRWSGSDAGGSGILYYEVRYRIDGGPWQIWQTQTSLTSATFTPTGDDLYEFEVRAVDNSGRVEPFRGQSEAGTIVDTEAPFVAPTLRFPVVFASSLAR